MPLAIVIACGFSLAAADAQSANGAGLAPATTPTFKPLAKPTAAPTLAPNGVLVTGRVRGYSFDRVNHVQNAANPNRHATAFSVEPHIEYRVGNTPLSLGYTYAGSTGFGLNGPQPQRNGKVDNTLPGFPLDSPVHEAYLRYRTKNLTVTAGNQELNYAWAPASDSRLIPAAYQALDATLPLYKNVSFGLTDIVRFETRNSSNFEPNTLLTAPYPGTSSLIAKSGTQTPGTLRTSLTYKPVSSVSFTAENYQFYDIANLTYFEGRFGLAPKTAAAPFIAAQFVAENSVGQKQVAKIYDHTVGAQLGATVAKGLVFTASADVAPWNYAYVRAGSAAAAGAGYFLPSGGTGSVVSAGNGLYKVAYGGIASPYSDSEATDPLYTTMITQGMVDRRSAGNSGKVALTYTTPNKRLKLLAAEGYFQYSNEIARNITSEYNLDGTYYLNKVPSGTYKGFLVRVRYAPRTIPTVPYNFQYQRFQTEYDF